MKNTNSMMLNVFWALIPAFLVKIYFWGINSLWMLLVAVLTSMVIELISSYLRNKNYWVEIKNNTALVSSLIIVLSLPPLTPYYAVIGCTFIAIAVAKQFYGGMGQNLFNPAMIGVAVFLVTYPQFFTFWQIPNIDHNYKSALAGIINSDATTGATPLVSFDFLDVVYPGLFYSFDKADIEFWSNYKAFLIYDLAFIVGGLYLLFKNIISLKMPILSLLAFIIVGYLHYLFTGKVTALPQYSLIFGSMIMGAFFIVTDPVTSPQYGLGRVIFALMVGALTYVIRAFSNYNDGVAFAVIFCNSLVPLLDSYFKPLEYGKYKY